MSLDAVSVVLILLAAFDWLATVVLVRSAQRLREPALTERASASVILSLVASGAALLALNRLAELHIPNTVAVAILCACLLAVSVPQIVWVVALAGGRFR